MKPGSRDGRSDLFPVVTLAAHALACPLAALGHPLGEEGRPALRAWLGHRPGPRRELAVRILVAGVESLAAPAPPFHELASAAGLGTGDAESDRLGRLALGITRAGDELPEASVLDHHGLAAGRAGFIGHLVAGFSRPPGPWCTCSPDSRSTRGTSRSGPTSRARACRTRGTPRPSSPRPCCQACRSSPCGCPGRTAC